MAHRKSQSAAFDEEHCAMVKVHPHLSMSALVQTLPRTRLGSLVNRLFGGSFALFYISGCMLTVCRMSYLHLHGLMPAPPEAVEGGTGLREAWFIAAVNQKLPFQYLIGLCLVIYAVAFGARAFAGDLSGSWTSHAEVYSIFAFVCLHYEQGRVGSSLKRRKVILAAKLTITLLLTGMLWVAFSMSQQHFSNVREDWKWASDPGVPKWLAIGNLYLILFDLSMNLWACTLLPVLVFSVLASLLLCFTGASSPNVHLYDRSDEDVHLVYKEGSGPSEGIMNSVRVRPRSLMQEATSLGERMLGLLAK
ncbi:U2 snRNP auxilliary factor [Apiospora arundinis]